MSTNLKRACANLRFCILLLRKYKRVFLRTFFIGCDRGLDRNDAPHDSTSHHETFTECTRQMLTGFHEISTVQSHASRPDAHAQLYDFVFWYIEFTKKYFCALFLPGRRSGVLTRQMLTRHSRIRRHPSKDSMKTRHAQLYDFVIPLYQNTKKYFCALFLPGRRFRELTRQMLTDAREIPRDPSKVFTLSTFDN